MIMRRCGYVYVNGSLTICKLEYDIKIKFEKFLEDLYV